MSWQTISAFLLQGSLHQAKHPISAYKEARELELIHEQQIIGNQPGDPDNAAEVLIRVAESDNRPLHLFLGSDAYNMAKTKIEAVQKDLDDNEALGKSTDFRK